jgi:prevent-host-death family protein
MLDMKTATVREVQHKLRRVLARIGRGEKITITRRGKAVARLVPANLMVGEEKAEWPDFEGRMRRLFPDGPPPGKPTSEVVTELREERS